MRRIAARTALFALLLLPAGGNLLRAETLVGAGATFPRPLYEEFFRLYQVEQDVNVHYRAVGSGEGIRSLLAREVDFGATDAYLTGSLMEAAPGHVLHLPTCVGAVTVIYNLPAAPELRLTPELIASIFLGEVRSWNDDRIRRINPNVKLPDREVVVFHRQDASGTTHILSEYLSQVSPAWRERVGIGNTLHWPVGYGTEGNAGVARMVQRASGSIGYVEMTFAQREALPTARIQNRTGRFINPSTRTVSLAADVDIPPDTRVSITDTRAPEGYPLSSFSWIILYRDQKYEGRSRGRALELAELLAWIIEEGQKVNEGLNYAPLPPRARERARALLRSLHWGGEPLLAPADRERGKGQ